MSRNQYMKPFILDDFHKKELEELIENLNDPNCDKNQEIGCLMGSFIKHAVATVMENLPTKEYNCIIEKVLESPTGVVSYPLKQCPKCEGVDYPNKWEEGVLDFYSEEHFSLEQFMDN